MGKSVRLLLTNLKRRMMIGIKTRLWEIMLMDDTHAIVPTDPQRQFEKMDAFDAVSRKLLDSELDNKKLRSLMNRICTWIADTRKQEQGFLAEASVLLNLDTPDPPATTPSDTVVDSPPEG